jgi:hypothetical protein
VPRASTINGATVNGTGRAGEILKDSAIVIAMATGLLYFWGSTSYRITLADYRIPVALLNEPSIEQMLARGAREAVPILLGLLIGLFITDRFFNRPITKFITALHQRGFPAIPLYYLVFLLLSLLLSTFFLGLGTPLQNRILGPLESFFGPTIVVKTIRLSEKNNSIGKYEGLLFAGKKGNNLVFADKQYRPTLYKLNEDEVKELILGPPEGDRK